MQHYFAAPRHQQNRASMFISFDSPLKDSCRASQSVGGKTDGFRPGDGEAGSHKRTTGKSRA
ncbi:MAG: hypothetical protein O2968_15855 [Acidobacteria bacterium]|nr:hypothetical protein [Acidobacteriota bacterium]